MEKSSPTLNVKRLKRLIAEGELKTVLQELISIIEGIDTLMTTEVYLTSARYRQMEAEKLRGGMSLSDYKVELNSITFSLLEIVNSLNELSPKNLSSVHSKESLITEIEALSREFEETNKMRSVVSQLRMKIHIARKIADKIVLRPKLMEEYKDTTDEAIICAIGRKIKTIPDIEDLNILESLYQNATTNIAKGFLTNALAELIYSGQLGFGDDVRVRVILEELGRDGDLVLLKNVERVFLLLDFLTGKIK